MADANVLTPATGPAGGAAPATGKRRTPWLIIIISAVVLVAGIGGALVLLNGRGAAGRSKSAAVHEPSGPPHYLALDPPFVVNFQANQLVRFLQVSVEVMSRDPKTLTLLKDNSPVLRNDLLILFGNQTYATLSTPAGKEQLRADALAVIRKDLAQAGGDPKRVAAVYFTSFVMQ